MEGAGNHSITTLLPYTKTLPKTLQKKPQIQYEPQNPQL